MRTFQYADARFYGFWNIEVSGDRCTVTCGKVGTEGQTQSLSFLSPEMARQAADQLIAEKVGKGYRETTSSRWNDPLRGVLEAAILEDSEDKAAHAALADYLHEQGDPQGEFMQVQLALEDPSLSGTERKGLQARERELLDTHQKEWIGAWTRVPQEARFIRGILAEARLDHVTVDRTRAFVSDPNTRLVRRLFVGNLAFDEEYEPGPDIPANSGDWPAQHALLRWPGLANVRVFQLGQTEDEEYGEWSGFNCHTSGDCALDFIEQMPHLEELYLLAHRINMSRIASMALPHLRILQVYHNNDYPLDKLAKNTSLGNLTHLLCHPHALDYDDDPYIRLKSLKAVLNSPQLKSLTHLRLRLADFGDQGVQEIVRSGILERLKMLDLRHGCITDQGAQTLAGCPDLKHLELLDVSRNMLTTAGVDALKATGVPVRLEHQATPIAEDDEDMEYLMQGDIE